jgi:hypothetical protein
LRAKPRRLAPPGRDGSGDPLLRAIIRHLLTDHRRTLGRRPVGPRPCYGPAVAAVATPASLSHGESVTLTIIDVSGANWSADTIVK